MSSTSITINGLFITIAFLMTLLAGVQCNRDDKRFQIEKLKIQCEKMR